MAVADRHTGKNMVITYNTTTVLSADYQTVTVKREFGKAEKSAGADAHASYIPTYGDTSVELEVLKKGGTAGTVEWGVLTGALGTSTDGTLIWAPEGTASGKQGWSMTGFIESLETEYPFDDVVKLTVTFQGNAAPMEMKY